MVKQEKWYSLGVVVAWVLVFWPGAFIYMMIKMGERNNG